MELEDRVVLSDINCPSLDPDGQHSLGICDDATEARECRVVRVRGHGACPEVDSNRTV